MAVTTLSRTRARRDSLIATTLSPGVLFMIVMPLALDFLAAVQPGVALATPSVALSAVAAVGLGVTWSRYPRTSWLAAALLAGLAALSMRLVGANVAPLLSLLAVVAVGIGGGFASPSDELETWFDIQPSVARR
jgi:hypothetical protein